MVSPSPRKTYSMRFAATLAAGTVNWAPGASLRVHTATSLSGREAQELGGGGGAFVSPSRPATMVTSVVFPAESRWSCLGTELLQSMEKRGSTSLSTLGRLSQIWKSSTGLEALRLRRGNISECRIPF